LLPYACRLSAFHSLSYQLFKCMFLLSLKQIFIVQVPYGNSLHSCRQSEGTSTCQRAVALVSFCLTSGDEKRKLLSLIPEPPPSLISRCGRFLRNRTLPQRDRRRAPELSGSHKHRPFFLFSFLLLIFASFLPFPSRRPRDTCTRITVLLTPHVLHALPLNLLLFTRNAALSTPKQSTSPRHQQEVEFRKQNHPPLRLRNLYQ